MARIDKRVTEWTRVSPSLGVRIMAVVNIVAALAIVGELVYEYFRYGTGWMENVEGGVAGACLLPFALPYLLLKRIRVLCGFGLDEVRSEYQRQGVLPFKVLGRLLKTTETKAADFAVYLTATDTLDGVLDWHNRQVVSEARFASDGSRHCGHCGAPYRLGGWCGYCGTGDIGGEAEGHIRKSSQ